MQLVVNGDKATAPDGANLTAFLASLGIEPAKVAVERNREIVPRSLYATTALEEGDRIEIVEFVGGG